MSDNSSKALTQLFSGIGHLYMHFATAMFFTVVLALETSWNKPFYELNELWTVGAALVGLAALPAGSLGDHWSARGMMTIFFIGLGITVLLCGFADGETFLLISLAGLGLFAAIYHPIGIPWLIANSEGNTGKMLAINGVFGGLGPAGAALVSGFLIELMGWRWSFWIPGGLITVTGLAMLWCVSTGKIVSTGLRRKEEKSGDRSDAVRAFAILLLTMFLAGLIYHTTQSVLPKFLTERMDGYVEGSVARAGMLVAVVYAVGASMQILGGFLADRYPLKPVYILGWMFQIAVLAGVSSVLGIGAFLTVLISVGLSTGVLPAENMLLYRYAPERHKGLAFGLKFVLAFGAAPLSLHFISFIQETLGGFYWVFMALALAAAVAFLMSLMLPGESRQASPAAAE